MRGNFGKATRSQAICLWHFQGVFDRQNLLTMMNKRKKKMRLIDADALIEQLLAEDFKEHQFCFPCEKILSAIKNAKTESWRPKAFWVKVGHKSDFYSHPDSVNYKCSNCDYEGYTFYGFGIGKTCPNCGAEMVGIDE